MTGFRIGPLDTDPKYKGQYRISDKEDELKKIPPKNYHQETVFVKKVSCALPQYVTDESRFRRRL